MSIKTDIQELMQELFDDDLGDALGVKADAQSLFQELFDEDLVDEGIAQTMTYHSAAVSTDVTYDPERGIEIAFPTDIATVEGWYEARLIDSPPANGANLASWEDESGNSRTATGSSALFYSTGAHLIGGQPSVYLDGTDGEHYTIADFSYSLSTGIWCYAVVRRTDDVDDTTAIIGHYDISSQRSWTVRTNGDGAGSFALNGEASKTGSTTSKELDGGTFTDDTPYLLEIHLAPTLDGSTGYVNGTEVTFVGGFDNGGTLHDSTSALTIGISLNGASPTTQRFKGDIAAIVWGAGVLTTAEKLLMRSYFDEYYDIL